MMIEVEQLRDFVSGNFKGAVISGKTKKDKVELILKLNSRIEKDKEKEYLHLYNVDLEELVKQPKELLNYLIDKYLENNTIIGVQYFVNVQNHSDKTSFVINSVNGSFIIALRDDCMSLLPDNFVQKLETAKKEGIIKVINQVDIKKIKIHNFGKHTFFNNYKTGLRKDTIEPGTYHYDALRTEDAKGNFINYQGEREFTKKILEILTEKGIVDLNYLKLTDGVFKFGYFNSMRDYNLNDKTKFEAESNGDLFVFMEFLDEYLSKYKDEVNDNQLKLVLERKGK